MTEPVLAGSILPDTRRRYELTGRFTFFNILANILFGLNDLITVGDPLILTIDAIALPFFTALHLFYVRTGKQRTTALLLATSLTAWLFFNAGYYGEQGLIFLFLYTLIIIIFFLVDFHEKALLLGLVSLPVTALVTLELTNYSWFHNEALTPDMVYQTRLLSMTSNLLLFYVFLAAIVRSTLANEARLLGKQKRLAEMAERLQELNDLKEEYNRTLQERLETALAEVRSKDRALDQAALQGEERERQRIAQELHDGVGAMLGTLKLKLGDFRDLVRDERRTEYAQAIALIDAASEEVRNASHDMQPLLLNDLGLVSVLQDHIDKSASTNGPRLRLDTDGYSVGGNVETDRVLYRIVQELLANALRHAAARHISIQLRSERRSIVLTVEDDGRGYDPGTITPGLGLRGIERRVRSLGGNLHVETGPGRGTVTIVELPAPDRA